MKEDVKQKILSPPLAGNQGVVTYIQPCLLLRGAFDFAAFVRRAVQRRCHPQLMIPTCWFHVTVALDAHSVTKLGKPSVGFSANHHPL